MDDSLHWVRSLHAPPFTEPTLQVDSVSCGAVGSLDAANLSTNLLLFARLREQPAGFQGCAKPSSSESICWVSTSPPNADIELD
jgi:hypothetical protein